MTRKIKKHLGDYHAYLISSLKDLEEAKAYLNVALEEKDPESFFVALRNVVEAHGITRTAKIAGLNRVSLYKMLSRKGNPSMVSLHAILRALGLSFFIDQSSAA